MDAHDLSRTTFRAALKDGPAAQPTSLHQFFASIDADGAHLSANDLKSLRKEINLEYPFLPLLAQQDLPPDNDSSITWVAATRSVLRDIAEWQPGRTAELNRLRALLLASQTLGIGAAGILSVAAEVVGDNLRVGLQSLIEHAEIGPFDGYSDRVPDIKDKLKHAEDSCDYRGLENWLKAVAPDCQEDVVAAVAILYQVAPDVLAQAVAAKNDSLFSVLVAAVLKEDVTQFAATVPLVSFKYLSICRQLGWLHLPQEAPAWTGQFQVLLEQVAHTQDWNAWMTSLFSSPHGEPLEVGLSDTLAKLEEEHWSGFIKAIRLRYSARSAEPVAQIMERFAISAGSEKAQRMWAIAFAAWDAWDYLNDDNVRFMDAPVACALDYPVVMHYACSKSFDLDSEYSSLTDQIENLERAWFESVSALVTERNRLLSRRRLVQHARQVVQGDAALLPSAVRHEGDDYARVRYRYYGP